MNNNKDKQNLDFGKFTNEIELLKAISSADKAKNQNHDLRMMDEKVSALLREKGEVELADSISIINKIEEKTTPVKARRRYIIPTWLLYSFATYSFVLVVALMAFEFYFTDAEPIPDNDTNVRFASAQNVVTLQPKNVTVSGYIEAENEFELHVAGAPSSDIKEFIKIVPEVDFDIEIIDNDGESVIAIKPVEALSSGQEYKISLVQGASFSDGSTIEKDINWNLNVEPEFSIVSVSPFDGSRDVPVNSPIIINFSADISVSDIENSFSISPDVSGFFTKKDNSLVFIPVQNFAPETEYTIEIGSLFEELDGNLESDFNLSFTTEEDRKVDEDFTWRVKDPLVQFDHQISTSTILDNSMPNISKEVTFELVRLDLDEGIDFIIDNGSQINSFNMDELSADQKTEQIDFISKRTPLNQGDQLIDVTYLYNIEESGVYILNATYNNETIRKTFIKTDFILFGEDLGNFSDGYIFDNKTLEPASNVEITSYRNGVEVGKGTSGNDGKYTVSNGDLIIAKSGDKVGIFSSSLLPTPEGILNNSETSAYKSVVATDSYKYKVDQSVYFDLYLFNKNSTTPYNGHEARVVVASDPELYWFEMDSDKIISDQYVNIVNGWGEGTFVNPLVSGELYLYIIVDNILVSKSPITIENSSADNITDINIQKEFYILGESINVNIKDQNNDKLMIYRRPLLNSSNKDMAFGELVQVVPTQSIENDRFEFTPIFGFGENIGYIYTVVIESDNSSAQPSYDTTIVYSDSYIVDLKSSNVITEDSVIIELSSDAHLSSGIDGNKEFGIDIIQNSTEIEQIINPVDPSNTFVIFGDLYETSFNSKNVFSEVGLKTDVNGDFKIELQDLEPGQYTIRISYGDSVNIIDNAFEIVNSPLVTDMLGTNVFVQLNAEENNDKVDISIEQFDDPFAPEKVVIIYGLNSGSFVKRLDAQNPSTQIERSTEVVCFIEYSLMEDITLFTDRHCTLNR